jgi:hypothetical protein
MRDKPEIRVCLFCGGRPVTLEHVIPTWLHQAMGVTSRVELSMGTRQLRSGPRLDVKLRAICASCNGGWLSDLEREFGSLMTAAIHGRPVELDAEQQRTAALWAAKTWLLLELALEHDRGMAYRSSAIWPYLHAHREPPGHLQIWAGGLEPQDSTIAWAATQPIGDPVVGVVSAYAIGNLLFQIYSPASETGQPLPELLRMGIGPQLQPGLVALWPPEAAVVRLPPATRFNLEELDQFWVSGKRITPPVRR